MDSRSKRRTTSRSVVASSTRSIDSNASESSVCSLRRARSKKPMTKIHLPRPAFLRKKQDLYQRHDSSTDFTVSTSDDSSVDEQYILGFDERHSKVKFSDEVSRRDVPSRKYMSPQERVDIWIDAEERSIMKKQARSAAIRTSKSSPQYVAELHKVLRSARYLAATTSADECYDILQDRTMKRYGKDLVLWSAQNEDSYRGLEPLVSQQQRYERAEVAKETRAMVVEMSQKRTNCMNEESVAAQYAEMNRSAVILARLLAESDVLAAAEDSPLEVNVQKPLVSDPTEPDVAVPANVHKVPLKRGSFVCSGFSEPTYFI